MNSIPAPKKGLQRIAYAFYYSLQGLGHALKKETAFRQETVFYLVLMIVLTVLPMSVTMKLLLFAVSTVVLVTELLNSALEAIVDMASPEYHRLAKRAKDLASAAVLLIIGMALTVWGVAVGSIIF